MVLASLSRMRRSVSFRIAVWYSIIFPLSSFLVIGIFYFLLSSYVNHKDRQILHAKLDEYASRYNEGGIPALARAIREDRQKDKRVSFFVRLSGHDNATVFLSVPKSETVRDYKYLERRIKPRLVDLITGIAHKTEEIATVLPDGLVLQVGRSIKNRAILLDRFWEIFAGIMIPVILLGFAGGAFLSHRALRPLRGLIDMVRFIIDTGKVHNRVPENHTGDETEELIVLFNAMLERIETLIDGMRGSLDNAAHDLRTPIARLRSVIEVALQTEPGIEGLREALMDCGEESERILTMVNTLMDISEAETGVMRLKLEEINLAELFEDVIQLYEYVAEDKYIEVTTQCVAGLRLRADSNRIRQVLANLVDNALKYTPRGGRVHISAEPAGQDIAITVEDSGEGIPEDEIPRIWDRLYRVDKSRTRRGVGLGLSLVKAIVHAHGGNIEVVSAPEAGSRFTVYLPARGNSSADSLIGNISSR
ncbi:MAG: sensor histidine kinase [Syntrophobacteraceae bacterium]